MPKTLTLSEPKQFSTSYGGRTIIWDLLDEDGKGYRISWIESAFDTNKPKCRAFQAECFQGEFLKMGRREQAVSYDPDAALALRDVMAQLKEKHGYTYEPEDAAEPVYLLPGEVVADGSY